MEKEAILHYVRARCNVTVAFPNNEIACKYCPFYHYSETYDRAYCDRIMGDNVMPRKFADRNIHPDCPLEFEGGDE